MIPPIEMTSDMMIVFGFLIFVTILFVFEVVRVDMVGLLMMVLLPLSGVITGHQAISGLSSNAVVSIIAVIIIGEGLDKTGVMNIFARHIIKLAGKSEVRIMSLAMDMALNTFMLPTHQVNALIMRPGGYKVIDYVRAGTGMTFLYIAVVMTIMYFFYGIAA